MSFENLNQESKPESYERRKLRIAAELQLGIMELVCSPNDGPDCFANWPKKIVDGIENGQKFRDLFESALDKDPEMIEKWEEKRTYYTDLFVGEFLETMEEAERRHAA